MKQDNDAVFTDEVVPDRQEVPFLNYDALVLIEWLKQPGDHVARGDALIILGGEMSDVELVSGAEGWLEPLAAEGDPLAPGARYARLHTTEGGARIDEIVAFLGGLDAQELTRIMAGLERAWEAERAVTGQGDTGRQAVRIVEVPPGRHVAVSRVLAQLLSVPTRAVRRTYCDAQGRLRRGLELPVHLSPTKASQWMTRLRRAGARVEAIEV